MEIVDCIEKLKNEIEDIYNKLFDGWYDSLINCEIEEFAKQIANLTV